MHELKNTLKANPVVYVTRDLERAIGLPKGYQNYYIVSNSTSFSKTYAKGQKNILLIREKQQLDTRDLLGHKKTIAFLKKINKFSILVFKNTPQIEKICHERNWPLINPPATLANMVEEKISQLDWLGPLKKYLPPHLVKQCKELKWNGEKYILQFNRAHTGSGTILIESEEQLKELQEKFPNREVRASIFVEGPAFTNNNVVWGKKVLIGNINYQITGLAPFTSRPFATIGNDWALPHKLLSNKQSSQYKQIATDVGKKLAKDGWKGLFGIDVIMDEKTGKLYLIEINARQPASTTYESVLQSKYKVASSKYKVSTFEAHLASLIGLPPTPYSLLTVKDGAQIVMKVKETRNNPDFAVTQNRGSAILSRQNREKQVELKAKSHSHGERSELKRKIRRLKDLDLNVIPYDNNEPEQDLLRIQSEKGVMERHNEFNKMGEKVAHSLDIRN